MVDLNELSEFSKDGKKDLRRMLGITDGGGGGNSEVFLVNYTLSIDEDYFGYTVATCDKTYDEILQAIDNKEIVVAVLHHPNNSSWSVGTDGRGITYGSVVSLTMDYQYEIYIESISMQVITTIVHFSDDTTNVQYYTVPWISGEGLNSAQMTGARIASGNHSSAGNYKTRAIGDYSNAEGNSSMANGESSHAEGFGSIADGIASHAEGGSSHSVGAYSHSEGSATTAYGNYSHVDGHDNKSSGRATHVFGEYNDDLNSSVSSAPESRGIYVEIVGNGSAWNDKSNARTLTWTGVEWTVGGYETDGYLTLGRGTTDEVTLTASDLKALLALLS